MGYIRDLEGIVNKDNKIIRKCFLIRSASLDKPTDKQLKYLNDINVKRIIDLRNKDEANREPDVSLKGCKYFNYSLIDSDLNGVTHQNRKNQLKILKTLPTMKESYIGMFKEEFALENIKMALREIVLNDGFPVIIHCATGKDRAGIITMLILHILNVDYELIVEDYLKQRPIYINTAIKYAVLAFIGSRNLGLSKKAFDFFAVKREFLDSTIDVIKEGFGSVDNFIHEFVGLTDEDINRFKNKVLI